MKGQNKLLIFVILLGLILLGISVYSLFYIMNSREQLENRLHSEISKEIGQLKLPEIQNGVDGKDGKTIRGITPIKGIDYLDGSEGKDGKNGKDGSDGINGKNGKDGEPGTPGRTLLSRCNPTKNRVEQKYLDTDVWEILYYLPEGSTCPLKEQNKND